MNVPNPNYLLAELLWAQLRAAGVAHAVISPGSRSTPLARCAALNRNLTCHVITDERSAGFFALGLAKGSGLPVALVCTSGTAAAHYYPAIIEAAQAGHALVVLSADRPPELRNSGAPQTIDQVTLFGRCTRMAVDLPVPRAELEMLRETLFWVKRALVRMRSAPVGPIQINVPLDEPLAPVEHEADFCAQLFAELAQELETIPAASAHAQDFNSLLEFIEESMCGLIVCGVDAARTVEEREAIHGLARKLGWPLLTDVASGLRFTGEPNLPLYDLFLRHEELARLAPDLVLEFGGPPTSKALTTYLNRHRAKTIRIQRDDLPRDPDRRATTTLVGDFATLAREIAATVRVSRDSLLLDPLWKAAGVLRAELSNSTLSSDAELAYVREILAHLPNGSNLVLASSMPIRYADLLAIPAGKEISVFAQRGTNGIDGVLSHAAGIAEATRRKTVLICGDLAFLHDLHGLLLLRKAEPLSVFILNNNGGGIFHFLPVAEHGEPFETIHGTPHDANLAAFCKGAGLTCVGLSHPAQVQMAFGVDSRRVFEIVTERSANRAAHDEIVETLLRALD